MSIIARLRAAQRPAPALVTTGAPHVRAVDSSAAYYRRVQLALLPSLLFGGFNVGLQANRALAELGRSQVSGWRGSLLELLGVGLDPERVLDCALHGALYLLPLWLVSYTVGSLWEHGFARLRKRALLPGLGLFALLFTLCLPPGLPLWQAALGISCGVVFGKEVFGGTGYHFMHPVLVGLAFLAVSYPDQVSGAEAQVAVHGFAMPSDLNLAAAGGIEAVRAQGAGWYASFMGTVPGPLGVTSTLACSVGAVYLLAVRAISWRILLGALLGLASAAQLLSWTSGSALPGADLPWYRQLTLGSSAFILVFIATDPTSAANTRTGRWLYGFLIGALIIVIRVGSPDHAEEATLAVLLGSVFAPLIDHGVVRLQIRKRRRRFENSGETR